MITTQQRFDFYLQYFIDGNVSLDYLKAIIVPDRILKTEFGRATQYTPNFIFMEGDWQSDIYDDLYYKIDAPSIRMGLTNVISYIQNSLFAQDISLLNDMASRFSSAIDINNKSNAKLQEEIARLNDIDSKLQAQLLEAKKVYTAYNVVMEQFKNNPDPVIALTVDYQTKINNEIARQETIKTEQALRLKAEEEARLLSEQKAQELALQIKKEEEIKSQQLIEAQKQAELQRVQAEKDYIEDLKRASESQATSSNKITEVPQKKTNMLPLVLGAGVLAWLGLSND